MLKIDTDAVSVVGCNIATGVVVEKLMTKKIKDKTIYVNALTLYRNFISCFNGKADSKIKMLSDVKTHSILSKRFSNDTRMFVEGLMTIGFDVIIYIPTYETLYKKVPGCRTIDDTNGLVYHVRKTESIAINVLKTDFKGVITEIDYKLPHIKDLYIMTHIGVDLLNFTKRRDVKLIESHTGEIKNRNKWYTKYYKVSNKDMQVFPFNEFLYMILGDGYLIKSANIKSRKWMYEQAVRHKWTYTHTMEMVEFAIKRNGRMIYDVLKAQCKNLY